MGRGGKELSIWVRSALIPVGVWAIAILLSRPAFGAGLIGGNYTMNWDDIVDTTGSDTKETRSLKHVLEVKYKGFLSPVVENELTLKLEQETRTGERPKTRVYPTISLQQRGNYWNAGAKRSIDETNEPGKSPRISDSYFVEFFLQPARRSLPDLKGKYTLDREFEEGTADSRKQALTLSSSYRPADWLDVKGDYSKSRSDDLIAANSDTEEEKITGQAEIRHLISKKIKLGVQYKVEVARSATLLDSGGATNPAEDQTHTLKNSIAYRPFADTDVTGSYDFDLKENMVTGEHTFTRNTKFTGNQRVGRYISLTADFSRIETEPRHSADDYVKTDDTWSGSVQAAFAKALNFTAKHQKQHTHEDGHREPSRDARTSIITDSASWNGELTPFWRASASYDKVDTFTFDVVTRQEVESTIDTTYSVTSNFMFPRLNLTLDPSYTVTVKDDLVKPATTGTRDFTAKVAWKFLSTNNIDARFDHSYGRKTDSAVPNISRTDSTTANVTWLRPFRGWNLSFDVTRSATDTSGDELPPDVTAAYGFKADYALDRFAMGTSAKYDRKRIGDDGVTFDARAGWTAPQWDLLVTYNYRKTYSATTNAGYSIGIAFKYNL